MRSVALRRACTVDRLWWAKSVVSAQANRTIRRKLVRSVHLCNGPTSDSRTAQETLIPRCASKQLATPIVPEDAITERETDACW
jgi:hypothetical protein